MDELENLRGNENMDDKNMTVKEKLHSLTSWQIIRKFIGTAVVLGILIYYRELFFEPSKLAYLTVEVPLENSRVQVFIFLIILTVISGMDAFRAAYFEDHREKRYAFGSPVSTCVTFAVIIANSVLSFFEIELMNNYYLYSMQTRYVWLGIGITLAIYLIVVFLVNSLSAGMVAGNIFFLAWGIANYFVQQFRGIPLQFIDFGSLQTAINVSGNYVYTMIWQIVACVALTCDVCGFYLHARVWHNFRKFPFKLLSRGISVALAAGFFGVIFKTDFLADQGIWLRDWQPWYTYRLFGMEAGFFSFAKASFPEAPETYSSENVENIEETALNNASDDSASDVIPDNIICIMDEAFSDLTVYPNFRTSEDVMPFIRSMDENTESGSLLVSVKGGTTANTEYEFLTGNSCVLSPQTVVYNSYIKQNQYSLARTLTAQGYTAYAMHPYYKNGWNREMVYPYMGFGDFFSLDNYFANAETVRGFVSDKADVASIINLTKNKKQGEKTFIFNVTMQNHSEYKSPSLQSNVSVLDFNGTNKSQAEQYLTLIKLTDAAVEELIDYYSASDEKTLICFWGDHQPQIGDDFWEYCLGTDSLTDLTAEQTMLTYMTRYFIWANYDIPEEKDETVSANYLNTKLLSLTGLKQTGYNDFLAEQAAEIPAMNAYGYMDTSGEMHLWEDADVPEETAAQLEKYKCLIYDELTSHSRNESFYGIADE